MQNEPKEPREGIKHAPDDPYKDAEFEVFLKEIGNANLSNWTIVAETLGVSKATMYRWRQHPLAKEAITNAIEDNLRKMTEAGKDDWRMYREKLKMLGVKDRQTLEHDFDESTISNLLNGLEHTDYGKFGEQAKQQQ